jgi:predicted RNase H-like HicB family nuclease
MDHKKSIASIKVIPVAGGKSDIHIEMPVWIRKDAGNIFYAEMALLGNIVTYGNSEADLDIAIKESIACFILSAEQHGKGLKDELIALGWQIQKNKMKFKVKRTDRGAISYNLSDNPALNSVIKTGVSKSVSLVV